MLMIALQEKISFIIRRGPKLNTGWPCEPPAPLESHHRRSPHRPVSREMNQPTLHTPSTSKSTVISKLIVKCKISFYLLYPKTYLLLSHSTFFFSFEFFGSTIYYDTHSIVPFLFYFFKVWQSDQRGPFLTKAAR